MHSRTEIFYSHFDQSQITNFYWLFLLIIVFFVFVGNIFLITLIVCNKHLYNNSTNKIIISLCVTDIMLSLIVMPFSLYSQINHSFWNFGELACTVWLSADCQLTSTSIFHLCSISYERYLSVAKPIVYRNNVQKRICLLISFSWFISFILVTFPFFILNYDTYSKKHYHLCTLSSSTFIAYTTVITFWIPLLFMVVIGTRTILLIRKLDRSHTALRMSSWDPVSRKSLSVGKPSYMISMSRLNNSNNEIRKSTSELVLYRSFQYLNESNREPISNTQTMSNFKKEMKKNDPTSEKQMQIPVIRIIAESNPSLNQIDKEPMSKSKLSSFNLDTLSLNRSMSSPSQTSPYKTRGDRRRFSSLANLSRIVDIRKSIVGNFVSTRKEIQAQKTLSIILIVFVFSYFPLFTYLTVVSFFDVLKPNQILRDHIRSLDLDESNINNNKTINYSLVRDILAKENTTKFIFYLTTWLGYSSAALNPLLHLCLNNNFKNALLSYFK